MRDPKWFIPDLLLTFRRSGSDSYFLGIFFNCKKIKYLIVIQKEEPNVTISLFKQVCHKTFHIDLGFRFPFSTLRFSTLLHYDPAAHRDHCWRCRIQTRDLCPRSSLILFVQIFFPLLVFYVLIYGPFEKISILLYIR